MEKHVALSKWSKENRGELKKLAEFVGVSAAFISHMVVGRKKVPLEHIVKISKFTNISTAELRPDVFEIFNTKEGENK